MEGPSKSNRTLMEKLTGRNKEAVTHKPIEHTRAAYEKAVQVREEAVDRLERGVDIGSHDAVSAMVRGLGNRMHFQMVQGAEKRLAELKESGMNEAYELNQEFDRLLSESRKANEALETFMRDKLGVQDDSQ